MFQIPSIPKSNKPVRDEVNPFAPRSERSFHFGTGESFVARSDPCAHFADPSLEPEIITFCMPRIDLTQIKTGEEEDVTLFTDKATLYHLKKDPETGKSEFVDHGLGTVHFNKGSELYRIVMRREAVGTVMLNCRVFELMRPKLSGTRSVRFVAQDYLDSVGAEPKLAILLLSFKDADTINGFISILENAISDISRR